MLGTLDRLDLSLRPGGIALIGEPYWREIPPAPEAVRGSQAESVEDYATLDGLITSVQGHGWDVVEMVLADEDSWDRYVAAQWLNIRRFCDENPRTSWSRSCAPSSRRLPCTMPVTSGDTWDGACSRS
ncbi:hypothetical protein [Brachybacterium sp. 107]|uniref:hypothetical protein n=1 Tax=Brachybacterium sp. 107 TaxID=3457736 RepID=UPI00403440E5